MQLWAPHCGRTTNPLSHLSGLRNHVWKVMTGAAASNQALAASYAHIEVVALRQVQSQPLAGPGPIGVPAGARRRLQVDPDPFQLLARHRCGPPAIVVVDQALDAENVSGMYPALNCSSIHLEPFSDFGSAAARGDQEHTMQAVQQMLALGVGKRGPDHSPDCFWPLSLAESLFYCRHLGHLVAARR